ncbi:IclR family transcriptional regulator [Subtercola frigoramans]|uniref:DNA-binding IclR family transcriptional regulator n=1 Tax=Subtercola frigoramans TaxID=120298 RepID=A0ABS2L0W4_9MICO|nr:IclR family transcriptional regulator [Subtercola frigoramans]MBM7470708.1 DNA-binding IclR family transcriptional regulator [Subtercola frigoramans]
MSIVKPEPPREQPGPRMPAVRNCIAVLRLLGTSTRLVSAGALARSLSMPRSSMYQLLQVLVDEGLVVHVADVAGFALGDGIFELGSSYSRRSSLENLAQPLLVRLARTVGESATLSILQGSEIVYLAKEQPRRPVSLVSDPGVHLPAHLTASGRAMLAALPRPEVLAWFSDADTFGTRGGRGPHSLRELRALLAEDALRGWSVEADTVTDGITCIAAAAFDRTDRPVAAVTASFPTRRGEGRRDEIAREVVRAADELTRRMHGPVPDRQHTTGFPVPSWAARTS